MSANTKSTTVEYSFILLMVIGLLLNVYGLYRDATAPDFNLVLDVELAGVVLIFFGLIADFFYSHY